MLVLNSFLYVISQIYRMVKQKKLNNDNGTNIVKIDESRKGIQNRYSEYKPKYLGSMLSWVVD